MGGLSVDRTRWIRFRSRFFLPIHVFRRVFRGKFVAGLKSAFSETKSTRPAIWLHSLNLRASRPGCGRCFKKIGSYSKPPFDGPEYVLNPLGRYTDRVAISNHDWFPLRTDR
jgi:hypothetical protein